MLCFFFSSRRRHTRCALVTGVQTCALPICSVGGDELARWTDARRFETALDIVRGIDPANLISQRLPFDRAADAYRLLDANQIGRAHVRTPVTNAHLVCRLLLDKKKKKNTSQLKQLTSTS